MSLQHRMTSVHFVKLHKETEVVTISHKFSKTQKVILSYDDFNFFMKVILTWHDFS